MITSQPARIFSMLEGYHPVKNIIGAGDPNVHKIDDQWWMFFGGFQRNFKNNLFCASLPAGEPLNSQMTWTITTASDNPKKAMPLIEQPDKTEWDGYGLHEPCYVEGYTKSSQGNFIPCQRIYYTGRKAKNTLKNDEPFSIGFLEKNSDGWERHPQPILKGDERNFNVLAPKVMYEKGKWRMWYRANSKEAPKGEKPRTEIYYTESEDGVHHWTKPILFFTREDEVAHVYPLQIDDSFEMLISKIPNLYGESFYPAQKLWLLTANEISGERSDWSNNPKELIQAQEGEDWYKGGFFGASMCHADLVEEMGCRYVFFTGIHTPFNKVKYAIKRIFSLKKPPIPSPFYFSIGYFRWTGEKE